MLYQRLCPLWFSTALLVPYSAPDLHSDIQISGAGDEEPTALPYRGQPTANEIHAHAVPMGRAASDIDSGPPAPDEGDLLSDEEDPVSLSSLSPAESRLRLLQREMAQVLGLPAPVQQQDTQDRPSFKRHSLGADSSVPVFPELPLDKACVDTMNRLANAKKWRPCNIRSNKYFHFPQDDFETFLSVPAIPEAARDKIAAEKHKSTNAALFPEKTKNQIESTFSQVDLAARVGIKCTSFMLLLTEFLARACEEGSDISPDFAALALRTLDESLIIGLEQFTRISLRATTARRDNVVSALNIPYDSVNTKLQNLPMFGKDLFAGQFLDLLETEAKRIDTTQKISFPQPPKPPPQPRRGPGPIQRQRRFLPAYRQPQQSSRRGFRPPLANVGRDRRDPPRPRTANTQPRRSNSFRFPRSARGRRR